MVNLRKNWFGFFTDDSRRPRNRDIRHSELWMMKIYGGAVDNLEVSPMAPTFPVMSREQTPSATWAWEFTLITATSPTVSSAVDSLFPQTDSYRDLDRCIRVLHLSKAPFHHTYSALSFWIISSEEKHSLKHLLIEEKQELSESGGRQGRKKMLQEKLRYFWKWLCCRRCSDPFLSPSDSLQSLNTGWFLSAHSLFF